jgi:hypothetical protein
MADLRLELLNFIALYVIIFYTIQNLHILEILSPGGATCVQIF